MKTRQEKIKTFAIIFLSIMLVLTFFSNSIMNYSLVEVSSEYIGSGKLTSRVRGSGTVETKEPYAVNMKQARKIKTMNVRVDQEVSTGDVLFTLDEGDSTDLKAAKKELLAAQIAYETAVLTSNITVEQRQQIESGSFGSLSDRQKQLEDLKAQADAANAYLATMKLVESNQTNTADAAEKALRDAKYANQKAGLDDQLNAITAIKTANAGYATETDTTKKAEMRAAYEQALRDEAAKNVEIAQFEANHRNAELSELTQSLEDAEYADELALTIRLAQKNAEDAAKALTDAVDVMKNQLSLVQSYETITDYQKQVADLEEEVIEPEFKSPVNGTVTEILFTAGQTPGKDETVIYIKPDNKAFTISFSTSQSNAGKIKVGDDAEVVNNWYGGNITAKVSKITKDRDNKANAIITCELDGDVKAGDSYTLSIGSSSSNYEYIVPTSSIREDSNGKFIYTIESKNTPLGNRYYARRCDIEVIAE
ncbi:MAG: HlyD family efflux transporter periplasmic adaptor subunit, partial [Bacteroidaceae bacterium]|nr:HlyD family efflux transporter periplasmic adaptor subunit [Bacteroidaceae bacterium]